MANVRDIYVIDSKNMISDVQSSASFSWRALDYPADCGAGLVDGRDYHKTESFVLHASDGDVIWILKIHLPAVRRLKILLKVLLRIDSASYSQSYSAVLRRRYHQLHYMVMRRVHDALSIDGHDQIAGAESIIEIGRSTRNDMTNRNLLTTIFLIFLFSLISFCLACDDYT